MKGQIDQREPETNLGCHWLSRIDITFHFSRVASEQPGDKGIGGENRPRLKMLSVAEPAYPHALADSPTTLVTQRRR